MPKGQTIFITKLHWALKCTVGFIVPKPYLAARAVAWTREDRKRRQLSMAMSTHIF
jgi:hypothetical protein